MQRSSDSIASLAAALAKAQAELVNPEKSQVATMRSEAGRGPEQTFRYAPLSSGLDIVRKGLGQHGIATIQTTAIDQTAGTVNLTTMLAHASGEWIASDWPVCAVSETATLHRMGAALTYARRYALFTLVGIAGEDDLDAPDLLTPTQKGPGVATPRAPSPGRLNGGQHSGGQKGPIAEITIQRAGKAGSSSAPVVLGVEALLTLCDGLVAQLNALQGGEDAALWAFRSLPDKNRLTVADAQRVEEAFQAKLADFAAHSEDGVEIPECAAVSPPPSVPARDVAAASSTPIARPKRPPRQPKFRSRSPGIDKTILALPEPRRVRDRDHVRYVARQPCLICGRQPCDAHHLRFSQSRALGRKVSDEFTVPLCRGHHREVHGCGDEVAWWRKSGIDPTVAARELWLETHPLSSGAGSALADIRNSPTTGGERRVAKPDRRKGGRRANRKTRSVKDAVSSAVAEADPDHPSRKDAVGLNLATRTVPVR